MTNLEKGGITMPKLNVLNVSGQNVGEIELSDSIRSCKKSISK